MHAVQGGCFQCREGFPPKMLRERRAEEAWDCAVPPATRKAQGGFLWEGDAPALTVHGDLTSSREDTSSGRGRGWHRAQARAEDAMRAGATLTPRTQV